MTGNKESLRMKLEDIAGEQGNMPDYPAIGDYQKMAQHLIVTSLDSVLDWCDNGCATSEEYIDEAIAIFTEDIFYKLNEMAEKVEALCEEELTYREAAEKVLDIAIEFEYDMYHEIADRIGCVTVLVGCSIALKQVTSYLYDLVQL